MAVLRFVRRAVIAVVAFTVVSAGLLAAGSAIAMGIDWDIPEGREIKGPAIVTDRDGRVLARLRSDVEFRHRRLDQISVHLQNAVIATEDRRFYEHQGVDPMSVARAVFSNVRSGGIREGGSTLTQQYVKNVFVTSEQTVYRKVREALVALQLEKERSKEEILEAYLNRVYFGEGAYGAEAAARQYFGKPAADLVPIEAAVLASVLSAPSDLSPRDNLRLAKQRRNVVLDEMAAAGFVREGRLRRMKNRPVRLADRSGSAAQFAPYFVEEVRRQLLDAYGPDIVYNGGLRVTTTLSRSRQEALEQQVRRRLPGGSDLDVGAAAILPRNGDVLAAWSGRDFSGSQVDLAFGRGSNGRPSGSTFKVFALVAALEEGKELTSTYPAPGSVDIGGWRPSGNGGCGSPCTLQQATAVSANTVFAQLANDVGAPDFTSTARRMGVRQPFRKPDLPMVLGTADVTPVDMASAFATLANDGVACPARVVTEVRGAEGEKLRPPDPRRPGRKARARFAERLEDLGYEFEKEKLGRCYRAVAPSVARKTHVALQSVIKGGTGRRAAIGRPAAGKTGTTQRNTEAWFVGYTPRLALSVALFNRDAARPLVGISGCGGPCFGGTLPATIWADAARALLDGVKAEPFPKPGRDEREGDRAPDRRRLGPAMQRPAPDPEPEPEPTEAPAPTEEATTEPPPTEEPRRQRRDRDRDDRGGGDEDEDDDGGVLPIP